MLVENGIDVDVAFMTRGEMGVEGGVVPTLEVRREMAACRTREAEAACDVLGVRRRYFFNGADTRLSDQPQLTAELAQLFGQARYQRVFCPWHGDSHEDHRATFAILRRAVEQGPAPKQFWLYEVWKPLPASTFVPIDNTIETKGRAVDQYQSQLAQLNYRDAFLGLASYRSLFCPSSRYAEAFLVCDRDELLKLG